MNNSKNKPISISLRISEELNNSLENICRETGFTKTAVIISYLENPTSLFISEGKQIVSLLYEIKSKVFSSEQNESEILQICDKINDVLFNIITKYSIMEDTKNGNSEND